MPARLGLTAGWQAIIRPIVVMCQPSGSIELRLQQARLSCCTHQQFASQVRALLLSSTWGWSGSGPRLHVWRAVSQLLRQPNMVRALARGTSTFQSAAAAAALAALPSLLRRYLSCGPRDGLADVLEGITAIAWHCHQLMIAHMAGPHAACSLPRAAWEGTASCFAALQGVLERGIPSLAMPAEDGVAELLATAMGMVEGLLPLLSYFVSAHGATTIDPADADAVASHMRH